MEDCLFSYPEWGIVVASWDKSTPIGKADEIQVVTSDSSDDDEEEMSEDEGSPPPPPQAEALYNEGFQPKL
eukprot:5746625-Amphidinium_carterae.1